MCVRTCVCACVTHPTPTLQVAPVSGDLAAERKKNLDILSSVAKKRAVVDAEKAANQHIAREQKRCI